MKPKKRRKGPVQSSLIKVLLKDIISDDHPLVKLADLVEWEVFEEKLGPTFCEDNGRPGLSIRLMVGLHYLKYTYAMSDEAVVEEWVENPYHQYFCGGIFFEHRFPIDPSSMTRFRDRLKKAGLEELLGETIRTGLRGGFIKSSEFKRVNVDTTVQEKEIRFPTDARLYDRCRERLVEAAKDRGIELRQSYSRNGKKALRKQSGYAHAQQFKRARRQTRILKTYLGRVARDIERKASVIDSELRDLLDLTYRLLTQSKHDKNELYSIHEPDVECISKGKIHKRYEFGCKVGIACGYNLRKLLRAIARFFYPHFILASCSREIADPLAGLEKLGSSGPILLAGGIPVYKSLPQAVSALSKVIAYNEFCKKSLYYA